jgi:hypothetical protein
MTAHRGKFVGYFRVSTDKQGKSGLGLEAQREAVHSYLNGGSWTLVAEFVEVESGKHRIVHSSQQRSRKHASVPLKPIGRLPSGLLPMCCRLFSRYRRAAFNRSVRDHSRFLTDISPPV